MRDIQGLFLDRLEERAEAHGLTLAEDDGTILVYRELTYVTTISIGFRSPHLRIGGVYFFRYEDLDVAIDFAWELIRERDPALN